MEDRRSDKYLTVSKFTQANRRLWYAVLIADAFLVLAVLGLAYSLREEGIARSEAVKVIAQQNTQLIRELDRIVQDGEQAHDALCVELENLEVEIARTEMLLKNDPGDIFGIPRELIEAGLQDDKDHKDALDENLDDCPQQ